MLPIPLRPSFPVGVMHNLDDDWRGCMETRYSGPGEDYDVSDRETKKKDKKSLFVPALSIDEPDSGYGNSYIKANVDRLDKSAVAEVEKLGKYDGPIGARW